MKRRDILKAIACVPLLDIQKIASHTTIPALKPSRPLLGSRIFFCPDGKVRVKTWAEINITQREDPNIIEISGWIEGRWESYVFVVHNNKMKNAQWMIDLDGKLVPFRLVVSPKDPFVSFKRHECDGDVFQLDIIDP